MPLSLVIALLWAAVAVRVGPLPRRPGRPVAWALIATGIPLLGLITVQTGPIVGLICLVAGVVLIGRRGVRAAHALEPKL